ncbi:NAD(P)/FAD-dependent oxidoreductase [Parasphingopyxis algicola]|uniref:NAD(P)/FAD-dependent oxidoreductase n=1 Tax=Parasphingopyxis algicola TaxID=2026624 RepID=UPI0015A3CBB9|nr:FAD/NAD(P)-binding oxidoreductase [Parasphingopyxis algicola]QLC24811.1 NAD(P)/FAD-dependent oxidoreductase [Parasphingopyxis algicola]
MDAKDLSPRPARAGNSATQRHDILIVGGGSAGIAVAASLLQRDESLSITIVEPRETHYYQPGWTMVGGGIFDRSQTHRPMASVIPKGVRWIRARVAQFAPDRDAILLEDGTQLSYGVLIVAAGIKLDWEQIDGLPDALGRSCVTSNYTFETAPYTWQLVQSLEEGVALFSQPPMPIKCAGAPQKVMYLACDHWRHWGRLPKIDVAFHTSTPALFGVADYVPALQSYVDKYGIELRLESRLIAVDSATQRATFAGADGEVTRDFDMLHVTPPQVAPDFIADSPLAAENGFVEVDDETLRHPRYGNVFALGDVCSAPNAKTAAAVRKQAPVVAWNILAMLSGTGRHAAYDGYGSCPLTVERGKIVLAEFGYGGELQPTFPHWLIDPTRPSRLAWHLKASLLPWVYWNGMLRGHEWLAGPKILPGAMEPPQTDTAQTQSVTG